MQDISRLISDYLDGELDADGAAQLADLLRRDPSAIDQLVLDSFVHSQLHDWMHVRPLHDELMRDPFRDASFNGCSAALELDEDEQRLAHARGRSRWLTVAAGSAASLLIVAAFVVAIFLASRPSIVAQLTQVNKCQWEANSSTLAAGALLHAGQPLELKSGRAMLTFSTGARLVLEGPVHAELVSRSQVDLHSGHVGVHVPTQAIGFIVATPVAAFVDLGTEFSLDLGPTNSFDLQVFDGMVEVQLPPHGARDAEQLRISQGSAIRFEAATFDVESIPYDEEQRLTP